MKNIKYILIFPLFLLFSDVSALQNIDVFSNLTISESGGIFNNKTDTACDSVGYNIETVEDSSHNEFYAAMNTSNLQTVYGSYGATISQCGLSFLANNYYSVTFYFFSDATYPIYFSPDYSNRNFKLALSNGPSCYTNFNPEKVDSGENVYPKTGWHVSYYTVIFKATYTSSCINSTFSTNPTHTFHATYNNLDYLGYTYESLGSSPPTISEIDNALSHRFDGLNSSINNSINDATNSINQNIDDKMNEVNETQKETNDKLDEANETSKGILGKLGELFSSIGDWFGNLLNGIKALFVGDEVCESSPNKLNFASNNATFNNDILTISNNNSWGRIEYDITNIIKENLGKKFYFHYESIDLSKFHGDIVSQISITYNDNKVSFLPVLYKNGKKETFSMSDISNVKRIAFQIYSNATGSVVQDSSIKIVKPMFSIDSNNDIYYTYDEQVCHNEGGLFGIIENGIKSIGNFFNDLLNGILEGLKSLFIPEDNYFSDYFTSLYDFFNEKLGILIYPIDLLIDVLNRFVNMNDNTNGLIHIPSISVGSFGELIKEREFYLNEYWNDEPYNSIYNVYKVFVNAFIGFCLIKLALKKEKEIIGGGTE